MLICYAQKAWSIPFEMEEIPTRKATEWELARRQVRSIFYLSFHQILEGPSLSLREILSTTSSNDPVLEQCLEIEILGVVNNVGIEVSERIYDCDVDYECISKSMVFKASLVMRHLPKSRI